MGIYIFFTASFFFFFYYFFRKERMNHFASINQCKKLSSLNQQLAEQNQSLREQNQQLITETHNMRFLAQHDSLSGLYNRGSAQAIIEERLLLLQEVSNQKYALLLIDLDHFKSINDTLGHNIGDCAIRELGRVLKNFTRSSDISARIGGDEFCLWLGNLPSASTASSIAERLVNAVQEIQLHNLHLTISVGIAIAEEGDTYETLVERADQALYHVKSNGRNSFHAL